MDVETDTTTSSPTTTESTSSETVDSTQTSTTDTGDETTAGPSCGDGMVQDGEECDIGDNNGPGSMCKADCMLNVCGDGDKGPFEGCDDGNQSNDDFCTNECKVLTCGNGMVDTGEECDDGNDDDNDACLSTCVLPPSPCGMQSYEANIMVKPVDIIFVIDNSESMGEEIKGVQDNINQNFAAIFEESGLDYRVIIVT
ncbi:MAG: vWA domain-containing protein [Nannocystaceae bacterium]